MAQRPPCNASSGLSIDPPSMTYFMDDPTLIIKQNISTGGGGKLVKQHGGRRKVGLKHFYEVGLVGGGLSKMMGGGILVPQTSVVCEVGPKTGGRREVETPATSPLPWSGLLNYPIWAHIQMSSVSSLTCGDKRFFLPLPLWHITGDYVFRHTHSWFADVAPSVKGSSQRSRPHWANKALD